MNEEEKKRCNSFFTFPIGILLFIAGLAIPIPLILMNRFLYWYIMPLTMYFVVSILFLLVLYYRGGK